MDWAQRTLLLEAAWALTAARAAVRLLPFRWIASRLGCLPSGADASAHPASVVSPAQVEQAQRLHWALSTLTSYLPWDARCLAQAVAGWWMLQRRGLPGRFYLGVDRGQAQWLDAHAWLRCGDEFITGEPQHERFKIIAVFSKDGT